MANAWPDYRNPFYDQEWQYTTPYSIYTSGMAWRKDKVNLSPSWNMPWQGAPYKGKVAVLDDYRESISLALLRAGNLDLNTTSTTQIRAAGRALQNLATLTNVRIDNNDYTDVPTGKTWIHHGWSGDMASSYQYLPKGTSIDTLGYWFPADQKGPVANDLMVNPTGGANPVLAHKFIDYMLNVDNALNNYIQPQVIPNDPALGEEVLVPGEFPQAESGAVGPGHDAKDVCEADRGSHANGDVQLPVSADTGEGKSGVPIIIGQQQNSWKHRAVFLCQQEPRQKGSEPSKRFRRSQPRSCDTGTPHRPPARRTR